MLRHSAADLAALNRLQLQPAPPLETVVLKAPESSRESASPQRHIPSPADIPAAPMPASGYRHSIRQQLHYHRFPSTGFAARSNPAGHYNSYLITFVLAIICTLGKRYSNKEDYYTIQSNWFHITLPLECSCKKNIMYIRWRAL